MLQPHSLLSTRAKLEGEMMKKKMMMMMMMTTTLLLEVEEEEELPSLQSKLFQRG